MQNDDCKPINDKERRRNDHLTTMHELVAADIRLRVAACCCVLLRVAACCCVLLRVATYRCVLVGVLAYPCVLYVNAELCMIGRRKSRREKEKEKIWIE